MHHRGRVSCCFRFARQDAPAQQNSSGPVAPWLRRPGWLWPGAWTGPAAEPGVWGGPGAAPRPQAHAGNWTKWRLVYTRCLPRDTAAAGDDLESAPLGQPGRSEGAEVTWTSRAAAAPAGRLVLGARLSAKPGTADLAQVCTLHPCSYPSAPRLLLRDPGPLSARMVLYRRPRQ